MATHHAARAPPLDCSDPPPPGLLNAPHPLLPDLQYHADESEADANGSCGHPECIDLESEESDMEVDMVDDLAQHSDTQLKEMMSQMQKAFSSTKLLRKNVYSGDSRSTEYRKRAAAIRREKEFLHHPKICFATTAHEFAPLSVPQTTQQLKYTRAAYSSEQVTDMISKLSDIADVYSNNQVKEKRALRRAREKFNITHHRDFFRFITVRLFFVELLKSRWSGWLKPSRTQATF